MDTFTSLRDGSLLVVDSISRSRRGFSYSYGFVQSDFSFIVWGKGEKRVTLYGGAGIMLGVTLSPATTVFDSEYSSYRIAGVDISIDSLRSQSERKVGSESARVNHSIGVLTNVYIPIGIEWRLAKAPTGLGRVVVFYEGRPNVALLYIPEYGVHTDVGMIHQIGVRALLAKHTR